MYGSSLNQSIKKIKAESIGNVFPFGDEVFEYNRNKKPEKVTFSNNDVTITESIYQNVANERIININQPSPEDANLNMFMKKMTILSSNN